MQSRKLLLVHTSKYTYVFLLCYQSPLWLQAEILAPLRMKYGYINIA